MNAANMIPMPKSRIEILEIERPPEITPPILFTDAFKPGSVAAVTVGADVLIRPSTPGAM